MHDSINTISSREMERTRLALLMEKHAKSGGTVTELPGYEPKPMPPRRSKIDPETVLKRKPAPRIREAGGRA